MVLDHKRKFANSSHQLSHLKFPRSPYRRITYTSHILNRSVPRSRSTILGAGANPIRTRISPSSSIPRYANQTTWITNIEIVVSRNTIARSLQTINPFHHLSRTLGEPSKVAIPIITQGDIVEGMVRFPCATDIRGTITR